MYIHHHCHSFIHSVTPLLPLPLTTITTTTATATTLHPLSDYISVLLK